MKKKFLNDHEIPMPPPGIAVRGKSPQGKIPTTCIPYGDTVRIPFKDTGIFGAVPGGAFEEELPVGLFFKGDRIGPFKAKAQDNDVFLIFLDIDKKKAYINLVQVRSSC